MDVASIVSAGAAIATTGTAALAMWLTFRSRSKTPPRSAQRTASDARPTPEGLRDDQQWEDVSLRLAVLIRSLLSRPSVQITRVRELPIGWSEAMEFVPEGLAGQLAFLARSPDEDAHSLIETLVHLLGKRGSAAEDQVVKQRVARLEQLIKRLSDNPPDGVEHEEVADPTIHPRDFGLVPLPMPGRDGLEHEEELPRGWELALGQLSEESLKRLIDFLPKAESFGSEVPIRVHAFLSANVPASGFLAPPHPDLASDTLLRALRMRLDRAAPRYGQRKPAPSPRTPAAEDSADLSPAERASVAVDAASSIDHALAMLFVRLGPPPEESEIDNYSPASSGGGGVKQ
ncbi:hypothetical protein [Streptomyces sp. NPDC056480]|uniref:hypothetical protein n=1 Tax=Streptomyces sp. NPDC056480 TaxID=3345833 RepID=UPI0036C2572C